jgi:hypothetical protein
MAFRDWHNKAEVRFNDSPGCLLSVALPILSGTKPLK